MVENDGLGLLYMVENDGLGLLEATQMKRSQSEVRLSACLW